MAEPFAPYAGIEGAALTGGEGGDLLQKLLLGVLTGTAAIPKNVIQATAQTAPPGLRREDYTDVPAPQGTAAFGLSPQAWQPGDVQRAQAVDAAMLTMGGTSLSAPAGAVGAGPVLRKAALPMDEASRMARAAEQGFDGPWYHGGLRMDRFTESGKINPKRATSGPMPYFTDNPEMASSYAMGKKPDTSLVDNGRVSEYFTVDPKALGWQGARTPVEVERSWHFLPPEVKADILDKATRVGYKNIDEAEGALTLHPKGVNATGASADHWDYIMKREARGNPLTALRDLWHDSGRMVDDPGQLAEVFRLAGYPHPISEARAPWTEARGVFPARIKMTNPLDTTNADVLRDKVLPALEQAFARDRSRKAEFGADMWDKNHRYTPREWVAQAKDDLAKGENSYVWTSIPDKVTNELRRLGYDGILDTGGKMGGQGHTVAIPFGPEQVRSQFAKFDPANEGKSMLLGAGAGDRRGAASLLLTGDGKVGALNAPAPVRGFKAMDTDIPNMQPETGLTHIALDRRVADQFSSGGKRKVNEVEVAVKKPFDFRNKDDLAWLAKEMEKPENVAAYNRDTKRIMGPDYTHEADARYIRAGLEEGLYQAYEVPHVSNLIRKRGYDGIYMAEDAGAPINLAVFDPKQIKLKGGK